MKKLIPASLLSASAIVITLILVQAFQNRHQDNEKVYVTGLGSMDFKSDFIVWSGSFTRFHPELDEAYELLSNDQEIIERYLSEQAIEKDEVSFSSVSITKNYKNLYNEEGKYIGQEFQGYHLNQTITIESRKVDLVEKLSRNITELIHVGVEFYSESPQYYYTRLSELKIEMVAAAAEDARIRAEHIATQAGARLGELKNAQMGVFQIIAQNSNEDYSWGGSFNTSSKMKTATITMRLQFGID